MRVKYLLAVAILLALGATACGSSSKSSSSSSFCNLARADDKAFSNFDPTGKSAAELKQRFQNLEPALQKAADQAPAEIKGDFQTFVNAFKPYLQALADANYDFSKLRASSVAELESPKVQAASDRIGQYFTRVCHFSATTT